MDINYVMYILENYNQKNRREMGRNQQDKISWLALQNRISEINIPYLRI